MFVAEAKSFGKKDSRITRPAQEARVVSKEAAQWIVLSIIWVAFLLRASGLDTQSLWRDEIDAIRFSSWPAGELISGLLRVGHNGPLFFLLLRPWRALTGDTAFALRYPSALLGTLAVPLGFILARQLGFSRRAGVLLGLLLASSPYLVWYGQEAKMYALLLGLITVAFIVYLKALAAPPALAWPWWVSFVIATTLSFYVHILAPLMVVVYTGVAFIYHRRLKQHWRGWLIGMSCLTLPYVPLALWQAPLLIEGFESGHPFYSAQEVISLLFQLYSTGLVQFSGVVGGVLYFFLLLCGLFLGDRSDLAGRLALANWLLLPPLLVYLISLRVQVFEDRYLIYLTPAFYSLIALGLLAVKRYNRHLAGLGLGAILVLNLAGLWQQTQPLKADFRRVAAYLAEQPAPPTAIMVQMPYLQHTLNYYYPADYRLLEGLWTNDGRAEATVAAEMSALTGDLTDLWLVVSEETLWDSRRLTRAWLNQNATLVDETHFTRVSVYHYRFEQR